MPLNTAHVVLLALALHALNGCRTPLGDADNAMQDTAHAHTNRLAQETSPYLLQHAHNPVDWYPWGDEAFNKAKEENKLVLVSVGYSSCHWCHVMEHESFEDDSVAAIMNERFVCIKVDREERPDVDQVYMTAVQLMTGRGGWPLNCFTLPDGRPVYGGTYFPKKQWVQLLSDLSETWKREPQRVLQYADQLTEGVAAADLVEVVEDAAPVTPAELNAYVAAWKPSFDRKHGGPDKAPKFPMPNNLDFLLRQGFLTGDDELKEHVRNTLHRMALGGLFDQVGGGFARYSTDVLWKVPHFEKMLYDNAQLVSTYSRAYQAFGDPLYRDVVERTLAFVEREMTSPEGAFYSALDADSEGEEGLFYIWTKEELEAVLGDDLALATDYYSINAKGLWERGRYILLRQEDDAAFAKSQGMDPDELRNAVARINDKLFQARDKRERPGLDDKALTSWSALMVQGYCDAYAAFGTPAYRDAAVRNMDLLLGKCRREDGGLWHSYKDGKATINGYLEDYAFTADALLALYGVTFDERWLREADALVTYARAHFSDERTGMFFFTSDLDPALIARKMEVNDNVTPASNSVMGRVLFQLGTLLDRPADRADAERMLGHVKGSFADYPSGFSNWAQLAQHLAYPFHEVAITGPEALERRLEFGRHYVPNRVFVGAERESDLPLLEDRFLGGTTIFVCEHKVCQLPVNTVAEALEQMGR